MGQNDPTLVTAASTGVIPSKPDFFIHLRLYVFGIGKIVYEASCSNNHDVVAPSDHNNNNKWCHGIACKIHNGCYYTAMEWIPNRIYYACKLKSTALEINKSLLLL